MACMYSRQRSSSPN